MFSRVGLALGGVAAHTLLPPWARGDPGTGGARTVGLTGQSLDLRVAAEPVAIDGTSTRAVTVNGQLPGPLLRWRQGDTVTVRVFNGLTEGTSIHWHGLLVPYDMDGVPGVSFPGIPPGAAFTYRFRLNQSGTYWYHSHSGLQEQLGHYGPIVIDPETEPVEFDREYVMVLSDWTFEDPHRVFAKLKKRSDVYNRGRTVAGFLRDARREGLAAAWSQRSMWAFMRMAQTDIADVTAATYRYLLNGRTAGDNWIGLFRPGERVRLRFINASAMSLFNIRIPGLPMTVVQADGQDVHPVTVDEFQIGVAETYDVVVAGNPGAHTIMCETNDRTGYVRGTLTSDARLTAEVPALRPRPLLGMKDMAMDHDMNPAADDGGGSPHAHGHHGSEGVPQVQVHPHTTGSGVDAVAGHPASRLHERPVGLEDEPHRVLVYADLRSAAAGSATPPPDRRIELHLTGNMHRYIWSFDGVKFSEAPPIVFDRDEWVRVTLVNDTMMTHPIHLHGMFFELVTGAPGGRPRKHTVVVKPGERMAFDVMADAPGDWAFHCHLLYHMHAGMMRVVSVRPRGKPA